jgi:methylisocitrate lyase
MYLAAGADIAFADALESEEELRAWAEQVKCPLLVGMTEFGKTPLMPVERIRQWGHRAIVIFPVTALRVAAKAVEHVFIALRDKGTQVEWLERMQSRQDLYELIGYWDYEDFDHQLSALLPKGRAS